MTTKKKRTPDREKGALKRTITKIKLAKAARDEEVTEPAPLQTYEAAQAFRKVSNLEQATTVFANICTYVSGLIGPDAPPANVADALATLKMVEKQAEAMNVYVRDAAIRLIKEQGQAVGEKGTLTLTAGNWLLEARRKNGTDPKKLEKSLREKGLNVEAWMTPTIKYGVDYAKLPHLVENGHMTKEEMENLAFDESWALQSPKHVEDVKFANSIIEEMLHE